MQIPGQKALNREIEKRYSEWAEEVDVASKMFTSRVSRIHSGEGFMLLRTNPGLTNDVKLDVFEIECDQVTSPLFGMYPAQYPDQFFDGVILDPWGNLMQYHVLRATPRRVRRSLCWATSSMRGPLLMSCTTTRGIDRRSNAEFPKPTRHCLCSHYSAHSRWPSSTPPKPSPRSHWSPRRCFRPIPMKWRAWRHR